MALKATLSITGHGTSYSVVECEYKLSQAVNIDGIPCDGVRGGKIIVTIAAPEKSNFLHEWMLNDHRQYDGSIKLDVNYNRLSRNATRTIEFHNAYCIELYEYFNNQNSDMMTMRLTLYSGAIFFVEPTVMAVGLDNVHKQVVI